MCFRYLTQMVDTACKGTSRKPSPARRDDNQLFSLLASLPDSFEVRDLNVYPDTIFSWQVLFTHLFTQ